MDYEKYLDGPTQKGFGYVNLKEVELYKETVRQESKSPKDTLLVRWADYRKIPFIPGVKTQAFVPFEMPRGVFEEKAPISGNRFKYLCVKVAYEDEDEQLQINTPKKKGRPRNESKVNPDPDITDQEKEPTQSSGEGEVE